MFMQRRQLIATALFVSFNLACSALLLFQADTRMEMIMVLAAMMTAGVLYLHSVHRLDRRSKLLEHRTKHDTLTGLMNRYSFSETVTDVLSSHKYCAVLLMDLNKFKVINDTLGHHVGDELLKLVAERLKKVLRAHDYIARLGGDEFAVLLTQYETSDNLLAVLRRLHKAFELPFALEEQQVEVGCSIGVAMYPSHGTNAVDLVKRADVAMYISKNDRLGFFIYDKDRDASSFEAMTLRSDLRQAVEAGQLRLSYQPKKSLVTGKIEGIEALARWTHEKIGDISPETFIPIAEQTGLIRPLTTWVLHQAISDFTALKEVANLHNVSINISPYSLAQGDLILHVSKELANAQLDPSSLILEITETALHKGTEEFIKVLLCLDLLGLLISIDDFGIGQSSLVYLKSLPVKEIKIDKSFVCNMKENKQDYAIVQHIITLAHSVGCTVCAEGVEDRETEDLLRSIGCDLVQGYHIAKPMPITELHTFLGVHNADK